MTTWTPRITVAIRADVFGTPEQTLPILAHVY
jgi:hypothetical protein